MNKNNYNDSDIDSQYSIISSVIFSQNYMLEKWCIKINQPYQYSEFLNEKGVLAF